MPRSICATVTGVTAALVVVVAAGLFWLQKEQRELPAAAQAALQWLNGVAPDVTATAQTAWQSVHSFVADVPEAAQAAGKTFMRWVNMAADVFSGRYLLKDMLERDANGEL